MLEDFDIVTPCYYEVEHDYESEDCWCHPDVEEYDDGVVLTHYMGVC